MALIKELKGSFVGGQVSPELQNRIDLEKFNTFLKEAKNTKIKPEGGISNRAGTVFIGEGKIPSWKLTINVNVSATIVINGEPYTGTSVTVDLPAVDASYEYTVSAVGYTTEHSSGTITEDTTIEVELEVDTNSYKFKITNSQGADIKLTANGTTTTATVENEVEVTAGTQVDWEVKLTGYVAQKGTVYLYENITQQKTLSNKVTLTITSTQNGTSITIDGNEVSSKEVEIGDVVSIAVGKTGYITYSDNITILGNGIATKMGNYYNSTIYDITRTLNIDLMSRVIDVQNVTNDSGEIINNILAKYSYMAGQYRIELGGQNGRKTDGSVAQAGKIQFEIDLKVGTYLRCNVIGGKTIDGQYRSGAIEVRVNNVLFAVAGGAGYIKQVNGSQYSSAGGSGYVGGKTSGLLYTNGYSVDGTVGNSTSNVGSNADGEYTGSVTGAGTTYYGYGGSGYIKTDSPYFNVTNITKTRHSGNAYLKIEFIG